MHPYVRYIYKIKMLRITFFPANVCLFCQYLFLHVLEFHRGFL